MLTTRANHLVRATLAGTLALHTFWILLFIKESSESFARTLTVHTGTGPLSGLYLYATLAGILFYVLALAWKPKDTERALFMLGWALVLSSILFTVFVYPPVFDAIL